MTENKRKPGGQLKGVKKRVQVTVTISRELVDYLDTFRYRSLGLDELFAKYKKYKAERVSK